MASTGKDADGNLTTQEYHVEGPVMLFSTTTAIDLDEELMNRCLVLTVNESREQTQQIHQMQRRKRTMAGLEDKAEKKRILTVHKNAQRLIKSLQIMNPFADQLTFLDDKTRTRRDHEKYLTLIDSIALLHQHQREIKTKIFDGESFDYVEVTLEDIKMANELAHEVLGRSLDELPPQTRNLLDQIHAWVMRCCEAENITRNDYYFSRKALRDAMGWGDTQLKVHLARLVEMEYLLAFNAGKGRSYHYELLYAGEGKNHQRFLMNLIEVEKLGYDEKWSGLNGKQSGVGRGLVAGQSGVGRTPKNAAKPLSTKAKSKKQKINGKTHSTRENKHPIHRNRTAISTNAELA
jgi:hypothetical protein